MAEPLSAHSSTDSTNGASASDTQARANQQGPATPQAGKLVAGAVTPQAGNSEASTPRTRDNTGEASDGKTSAPLSLEDALDALKKERAEAARLRKKAQDYDALLEEQANAKLSETEKLQKQLADLQRARDADTLAVQERVIRAEVRGAARDLGLNPELALKLIDLAAVDFNDAGDPTNISELLQEATQKYGLASQPSSAAGPLTPGAPASSTRLQTPQPFLAAQSRGATNPGAGRSVGVFTREQIARMSPREYAANQQAIYEAMKNGQVR